MSNGSFYAPVNIVQTAYLNHQLSQSVQLLTNINSVVFESFMNTCPKQNNSAGVVYVYSNFHCKTKEVKLANS